MRRLALGWCLVGAYLLLHLAALRRSSTPTPEGMNTNMGKQMTSNHQAVMDKIKRGVRACRAVCVGVGMGAFWLPIVGMAQNGTGISSARQVAAPAHWSDGDLGASPAAAARGANSEATSGSTSAASAVRR